jgi:hypothetical protein
MYAIARIWVSAGIPAPTVGLVFGTGRGGIDPSQVDAGEGAGAAGVGRGAGAGATVTAASAAGGVDVGWSQAEAPATAARDSKMRIRNVRRIDRSDTTEHEVRLAFPLAWACLLLAAAASADEKPGAPHAPSGAVAKIECARVGGPGRVRCEVEVRPPTGAVLRWADVVLVRVPPFAAALRGRVGSDEASIREETVWRFSLALAARARGTGEVEARVRLIACHGDAGEVCTPYEVSVRGQVVVGD